jgi:outer membrane protein
MLVVAWSLLMAATVTAQAPTRLTLQDAESRALQNNPRIRSGEYTAMAASDAVREVRSAYFPALYGSLTGAEADANTRITAGGLNNPTILDRFAYGVATSQTITDFGRTSELVASAQLRAVSQQQEVANRRASVLLDVDSAYFNVLRATAVSRIAEQTVSARQVVVDQVNALMNSGLKSSLDLSFAKVSLGEAQLLLVQAQNDVQASFARLSQVLGDSRSTTYEVMEAPMPPPPADTAESLIADALQNRPDVARERFAEQSAAKLAAAEHSLWLPTVSLIGAAGLTPYRQSGLNDHYAALGVNISVPVLNGGLFSARRGEANFRAMAQQQALQELENSVARDVRVAWLDARTAQQRLALTGDILAQATDAVTLAQQRYNLGLSSIVELTQAQLNQTRAQIDEASARYEYQTRVSMLTFQTGARK